MTDQRELDRLLDTFFAEGTDELADRVIDAALVQVDHTQQRRALRVSRRFSMMKTPIRVAAAAVIGVFAIGAALYLLPSRGGIGGLGPSPSPTPAPSPTATPVVEPSSGGVDGSPSPALIWSRSSQDRDWPAPVRSEPAGHAVVVPLDVASYTDPLRDIESSALPWVDIENVHFTAGPRGTPASVDLDPAGVDLVVYVDLAAPMPLPVADPTEQWIAYGLAVDTNADGRPDVRLGIDNMPTTGHRAWRTDLGTGRTMSSAGAPYGSVGNTYFDTFFPGEGCPGCLSVGASARFGLDRLPDEPSFRFYVWASVIEDGRVVATDYAPDSGWLDPWPVATP